MKKFVLFAFFALAIVATSCTQRLIDFTIISSKNHGVKSKAPVAARVMGKSQAVVVLIPLGVPDIKAAVDNAIETAGPGYDALVDGVLYYYNYSFIFGVMGYKIEGTPIKTQDLAQLQKDGVIDLTANIVYHSKLNKDNGENISKIPVVAP